MEKKITITVTETGSKFHKENISSYEALGILRFYEKQLWLRMAEGQEKSEEKSERISIHHFISDNSGMSTKLKNGLLKRDHEDKYYFPFLDCVNKRDFFRIRGLGKKSWHEFNQIIAEKGYKIGL